MASGEVVNTEWKTILQLANLFLVDCYCSMVNGSISTLALYGFPVLYAIKAAKWITLMQHASAAFSIVCTDAAPALNNTAISRVIYLHVNC